MSKPAYKSQTIVNAVAGYIVLIAPLVVNAYQNDRFLNEIELASVLGGAYTLKQTVAGRLKAKESIGDVERFEDTPSPSYYIPTEPNYEAVSALPSAEYASAEYASAIPDTPVQNSEPESIDSEEDDLDIDLSKLEGNYYLVALEDSKLKTSVDQSADLASSDWLDVAKGKTVYIDGWNYLGEKNNHIAVKIEDSSNINNGEFFVYAPHFDLYSVLGTKVAIKQAASPIPVIDKKLTAIKLPGYSSTFYLENPIYDGSHFTWREATRNGQRMPSEKRQVDNIVAVARKLDLIREYNGNKPMVITSWLRPDRPVNINKQVGGVANSRHITGDGIDFAVPGANLFQIQERMKSFCQSHNMGLGLGANRGFIHVDLNGFRVWNY